MRIRCSTLFDITMTGVSRRHVATVDDVAKQLKQRNQQINLETILQIISMRCQPEEISNPDTVIVDLNSKIWGTEYHRSMKTIKIWTFEFSVHQRDVFFDGVDELGNLYADSNGVPMIVNLEESSRLAEQINTSKELKNIHFEILSND